jgi:hypothetical protein
MKQLPPLLMLCEGRKPRLRKAPTAQPKEIELHKHVVRLLRAHIAPGWKFGHAANGEARDPRTAAKLKSMGVCPGWPDLTLISPAGVAHFLELKRPGGRLSDPQESFQSWAHANGVALVVADSLDLARAALTRWGAINLEITNG